MVVTTTRLCDFAEAGCKQAAMGYRLWQDGDKYARELDLCDEHAAPLLLLFTDARQVELPARPRVTMSATKLKTTDQTRHLKKR